MRRRLLLPLFFIFVIIFVVASGWAQTPAAIAPVPPLVKFNGTLANTQGTVGVIFALYTDQTGGAPLWLETQNVTPDANGRYTVYLGVNHANGVPLDLFASVEAHWLGVQPEGQAEQARVQLVSVPYALKAADAATLGGQPLSAFVLAANAGTTAGTGSSTATANGGGVLALASPQSPSNPVYTSGSASANYMAKFSTATDVEPSSVIYDSGSAVGIGTAAPLAILHVVSPTSTAAMIDAYSGASTTSLGALPMISRAARGTAGSPSAVKTNDYLGGLGARAYTGTTFTGGWRAAVLLRADQDWTDTAQGTNITFGVTAPNTTAQKQVMWLTSGGALGIGINSPDSLLTVAGPIHSTTGGFKFPDGSTQVSAAANVTSGSGLISNVTSGVATLGVDNSVLQKRVSGTCPNGAISQIGQDGTVSCVAMGGPLFIAMVGGEGLDDPGNIGAVGTRVVTDQAITVTKVSYSVQFPGYGCTPAVARITNGTVYEDVAIPSGVSKYDTADHTLVFPAGSEIKIMLVQAASCGQNYSYAYFPPTGVGGSVRYRLGTSTDTTSCPPNLTLVNGSCVDLQSDAQNCGSGGNVCTAPANGYSTCSAGQCGVGPCISGATLSNGQCSCYSGSAACSSSTVPSCKDLSSDPSNCGACGNVCTANQTCQAGKCQAITCTSGYTLCGTNCTNMQTDINNCGVCGNGCTASQSCQAGKCQGCGSGQTACTSYNYYNYNTFFATCVNTQTDFYNCGACGYSCTNSVSNGTSTGCWLGRCGATCNSGYTACTSPSSSTVTCTNLSADSNNCGACGNICGPGQSCQVGICQPLTCASGQTLCGTTCVNTLTDSSNCGGCGRYCSSPFVCLGGNCQPSTTGGPALTINLPIPPTGLAGYPYSLQLSASGGIAPYTFAQPTLGALPASMQLSTSGLISGTLPPTAGNVVFTALVRDSSNPPGSGTAVITIPVAGPVAALTNGRYFLAFYGFNDDGTRLIMAGSLGADGNGNITSGVLDVNSETGSFTSNGIITGIYTLASNLSGSMTLNLSVANFGPIPNSGTPANATVPTLPATFALALYDISNICSSGGSGCRTGSWDGRLIGFDDPITHIHGQGSLHLQALANLTLANLQGSYAFAGGGSDINGNALYIGSAFGLDTNGNITTVGTSPNVVDMATYSGGSVTIGPTSATLIGSVTLNPVTGRLFLTMAPSTSPTGVKVPTHYVAYMNNWGSGAYLGLLSVDSYDPTNAFPIVSTDMYFQSFSLPATSADLAGSFVEYGKGRTYSGSSVTYSSQVGEGSCTSAPACSLNASYLSTGAALQSTSGAFTNLSLSGNGRFTMTDPDGSSIFAYLVRTAPPSAILFEASPAKAKLGWRYLSGQSLPLPTFTYPSNFVDGITSPQQLTQYDSSGVLTLSSATGALGTLAGTVNQATKGSIFSGNSFGPWNLQTPNSYGVSQTTDGSNNLLGVCAFGSATYMYCLPNSAEPNGDTPSVFTMNKQ